MITSHRGFHSRNGTCDLLLVVFSAEFFLPNRLVKLKPFERFESSLPRAALLGSIWDCKVSLLSLARSGDGGRLICDCIPCRGILYGRCENCAILLSAVGAQVLVLWFGGGEYVGLKEDDNWK